MRRTLLAASLVALVVTAAGAAEPPPAAVVASVPFEASGEPNRIVVDLAPEGAGALPLLLDTGSTHSVLTPLFARAFGVPVPAGGASVRRATRLGREVPFQIDRANGVARSGLEYGLLGGDFLAQFVLEIDFAGRRVRFLDPHRFAVPEESGAEGEAVVALHVEEHRPFTDLLMNGASVRVLLDTGAHDPLLLSRQAARALGVGERLIAEFGELATPMGPVPVDLYETRQFAFAGFRFGRMPVTVAASGWSKLRTTTESAVGYDTLQQFTVRIDYPRRRLWLRREHEDVTFMGLDYALLRRLGVFFLRRPDGYEVAGVLAGTAAARLGLRVGDLVPDQRGGVTLADALARIAAGEPVVVARELPTGARALVTLPPAH